MGGIEHVAGSISVVLHERLPWQRKTQRENLALLIATMLSERSANLMSLAAALPRPADRIDMRYQWIVRVLANPLIECDAVMLPFASEVLARAQADAGPEGWVDLILDQSRVSERHQILMLALRWGERALPLAWRVEETEGAIGFGVQKGLLDTVVAWLPEEVRVRLLGDRLYGTPALIGQCQSLGWDYRLRLKGNLRVWIDGADAGSVEKLARDTPYLTGVELTARRVRTNIGLIQDPGHEEPWIVAMSEAPGYLTTLDYARRWGIEVVFPQMTKADVFAFGAGRQHVTDLDFGVGDDHAVDEQLHELPALLEVGLRQPALHACAERLERCRHPGELLLARRVVA